jgi:hypothetical protein
MFVFNAGKLYLKHLDLFYSNFGYFFDAIHGNCYVFNSGWNESSSLIYSTSATGNKNGTNRNN